eukprot:gene9178-1469_t
MSSKRRGMPNDTRHSRYRFEINRLGYIGGALLVSFVIFLFVLHHLQGTDHLSCAQTQFIPLSNDNLIGLASKTSLVSFKNELLKPLLVPRPVGSSNHRKAREHITAHLKQLGWHVELDSFMDETPYGRKIFHNIVATFDPDANSRIIFAAHYDSKLSPEGFVGAMDSAVPCAMLLDLAATLTPSLQSRIRGRATTIQLVFFDGEEAFASWTSTDSIYGARHLAQLWEDTTAHFNREGKPVSLIENIECLILLDLLGLPNPTIHSAFPDTHHLHKRMADLEKRLSQLGLIPNQETFFNRQYSKRAPRVEDDHIPFMQRGVPIMHVITVPFPQEWHTLSDNAAALDDTTMTTWLSIIRAFAAEYLLIDKVI